MTIGHWSEQAHAALRTVQQTPIGQPPPAADIYATIAARAAVYSRLAHLVELLVGASPAPRVRRAATVIAERYGPDVGRLYATLQAAGQGQQYPAELMNPHQVTESMRRAANAIGVMGDIVATHVVPGRRPRTPEGAAIRAGGGVQAALGSVARLAVAAAATDRHLLTWHSRSAELEFGGHHSIVAAIELVATSRIDTVAHSLIAAARDQPVLLDELDAARQPSDLAPAAHTAQEAITAVTAARTGLWQQPEQVAVAHLQLVTQLGLAVHLLIDDPRSPALDWWREAAAAASQLRGTPAVDVGRAAAVELAEVLTWARSQLGTDGRQRSGDDLAQLTRVAEQLPALARTMHGGLRSAVQRGDLFVRDAVLQRRSGSLLYHATQRWRPAFQADDPVSDLSRNLWRLQTAQLASPREASSPEAVTATARPAPDQPAAAAAVAAVAFRPAAAGPSDAPTTASPERTGNSATRYRAPGTPPDRSGPVAGR